MTVLIALVSFLIFLLIWPLVQAQIVQGRRIAFIRMIERQRGTRLITLIDRRRRAPIFGFSFQEFIDIEDAEEILRAIRLTPASMPIDLVIHTPGGIELAVEQIVYGLLSHPAKVTVFVPHFALSGGTMLALAADEIRMDRQALLGRLDPQILGLPAVSIAKINERKVPKDIDDQTIALIDVSQKAIVQTRELVEKILLANEYPKKEIPKIVAVLTEGRATHDEPITFDEARDLGLRVNPDIPVAISELLRLYPPRKGASPVYYIPSRY
ncbi:MAG TPA: hypothetical protein VMW25_04665 [Clostridia bacterium]|nr:hypothetical protein [Clostridia bacterium]